MHNLFVSEFLPRVSFSRPFWAGPEPILECSQCFLLLSSKLFQVSQISKDAHRLDGEYLLSSLFFWSGHPLLISYFRPTNMFYGSIRVFQWWTSQCYLYKTTHFHNVPSKVTYSQFTNPSLQSRNTILKNLAIASWDIHKDDSQQQIFQ
jgi:hypothetical protein